MHACSCTDLTICGKGTEIRIHRSLVANCGAGTRMVPPGLGFMLTEPSQNLNFHGILQTSDHV